jgi:hypothetical protein
MKHMRNENRALFILNLALDEGEWSVSHWLLCPGEKVPVPFNRKLGWPQSQPECCGKKEISLPLPGTGLWSSLQFLNRYIN